MNIDILKKEIKQEILNELKKEKVIFVKIKNFVETMDSIVDRLNEKGLIDDDKLKIIKEEINWIKSEISEYVLSYLSD